MSREVNKRIRIDAQTWYLLEACLVDLDLTFGKYISLCINELLRDVARDPDRRAELLRPYQDRLDEAAEYIADVSQVESIQAVLKSHPPQD